MVINTLTEAITQDLLNHNLYEWLLKKGKYYSYALKEETFYSI